MIECAVVGDSIGVGVSEAMRHCKSYARIGINSSTWNRQYLHQLEPSKILVISLGANDRGINTVSNLRQLRIKTTAETVYWILPNKGRNPVAYDAVKSVATEYGDILIERPTENISSDGVHPTRTGYKKLSEKIK